MSITASTSFSSSFDQMVKHSYQGQMKLGNAIRTKKNVVGSTHRFNKLGSGLAQVRIPQTDIVPMNLQHSGATATLVNLSAPEFSDIYDLSKLPFDEKSELAFAIGGAMGRKMDQLIIDALNAAATSNTVGINVPTTNAGLVVGKILRAKRLLDDNEVPAEDRFFVISGRALEEALAETSIGSADFNVLRPLVSGEMKFWAGFTFIMIGSNRSEGGMPTSGNNMLNYAFHKQAVGLAVGLDMRTESNYIAMKTSWLVNGIFSAGSVAIDNDGIVEVATFNN